MADNIEWIEEPPAPPTNWVEQLSPLLERPGQWAIVARKPNPQTAYSTARNLRSGAVRIPRPEDPWDFRAATDPETGEGIVSACYQGATESEPKQARPAKGKGR